MMTKGKVIEITNRIYVQIPTKRVSKQSKVSIGASLNLQTRNEQKSNTEGKQSEQIMNHLAAAVSNEMSSKSTSLPLNLQMSRLEIYLQMSTGRSQRQMSGLEPSRALDRF